MLERIPADKNEPDRVERWIEWLDSPYWEKKAGLTVRSTTPDDELSAFAAAMD